VAYISRSQNSKSCQRPKGTWKLNLSIKDAMLFMVDSRLVFDVGLTECQTHDGGAQGMDVRVVDEVRSPLSKHVPEPAGLELMNQRKETWNDGASENVEVGISCQ